MSEQFRIPGRLLALLADSLVEGGCTCSPDVIFTRGDDGYVFVDCAHDDDCPIEDGMNIRVAK